MLAEPGPNMAENRVLLNEGVEEETALPPKRIKILDIIMIALAAFSVILLVIEYIVSLSPQQQLFIIYADLVIVGIFLIEYIYNIRKSESKIDYVIERWYDLLGMIPAAHPLLRGFRLFRIFRVAVIAARLQRTLNLAFGENILFRILNRYKNLIVDELYHMMTIRSLDLISEMIGQTDYSNSVKKVVLKRQDDINNMMIEKMDKYVQPSWIANNFIYRRFRDQTSSMMTGIILDTLEDEKTNEIMVEVIKEILEDLRADVIEGKHKDI